MQCESCGAPLTEAKCLYCGRLSVEFLEMEANHTQHTNEEITNTTDMPFEQPQTIDSVKAETTHMPIEVQDHKKNKEQAVIRFLLCLFLGIFGAHYFYNKRFVLGILYLLTTGLFWIGWIVDCIRLLINMIRVLQID